MQSTTGGLRLELATSPTALGAHTAAWQQLAAECEVGDWFCSPMWLMPWLTHFATTVPCRVLFGYEAEQLVGVLPLVGPVPAGFGRGSLCSPVNVQVRRVGLMMRRRDSDFASLALHEALRLAPNGCVTLSRVPLHSDVGAVLDACVRALGLGHYATPETSSAVSDLREGWPAYLATRDGKLLRNLRARERRLLADGQWQFVDVTTAEELDGFWMAVLDVEAASWKQDAHSALTHEPIVADFYRDVLARAAQQGALRCHLLRHEGQAVAYAAGVEIRGVYYLLKNSYRASHKTWAPGMQLVWYAMQQSAQRGAQVFDFLGDVAPWKRDLATDVPAYSSRTLFSSGNLGGRLRAWMEMQLKPAVRESRWWQRYRVRVSGPAKPQTPG